MLSVIKGGYNSGALELLATLAKSDIDAGKKVICGGCEEFAFDGYEVFDMEYFMSEVTEYDFSNITFVFNEVYHLFDSRISTVRLDKLFTSLIASSQAGLLNFYIKGGYEDRIVTKLRNSLDNTIECLSLSTDLIRTTINDRRRLQDIDGVLKPLSFQKLIKFDNPDSLVKNSHLGESVIPLLNAKDLSSLYQL